MAIARILSIGTELTRGLTVDTNASWLSQRLGRIGLPVDEVRIAPDDEQVIAQSIADLADGADAVLITGGLGPTADDLAREGLARAMGVPLEVRPEQIAIIRSFFEARGRDMPASNARQAMAPAGATVIPNTAGTAPGIRAHVGACAVFALPGVPVEMRAMFEASVVEELRAIGGGRVVAWRTLNCYGSGESDMGEALGDLMRRGRNPEVGITATDAVMTVRIWAEAATSAEAEVLLARDIATARQRLGDWVFGEGDATLADAASELLLAFGRSVAVAESCTGGAVGRALTDVPGSSAYFQGGVVAYANAVKTALLGVPTALMETHGAVSEPVAGAMAIGCRERFATDFAISTTGIAGPGGATSDKPVGLVYFGLAHADGCETREVRLGSHLTREQVRDRATKTALNLLRRFLLRAHRAG